MDSPTFFNRQSKLFIIGLSILLSGLQPAVVFANCSDNLGEGSSEPFIIQSRELTTNANLLTYVAKNVGGRQGLLQLVSLESGGKEGVIAEISGTVVDFSFEKGSNWALMVTAETDGNGWIKINDSTFEYKGFYQSKNELTLELSTGSTETMFLRFVPR